MSEKRERIAELEAKLEESLSGTGNLCYECSEHIKSVRLEEENQRLQLKIRQHKYRLKTIKNVCEGDD